MSDITSRVHRAGRSWVMPTTFTGGPGVSLGADVGEFPAKVGDLFDGADSVLDRADPGQVPADIAVHESQHGFTGRAEIQRELFTDGQGEAELVGAFHSGHQDPGAGDRNAERRRQAAFSGLFLHDRRAGAARFLVKDIQPEDFLQAVRVAARGDALLAPSITCKLIDT